MNQSECQQVIDKLDGVISDTRELMERFEATGMEETMPNDYHRLETIITQALKDQRHYTQVLLGATEV
ncbi:hypothetical protein [Halomonas sp. WWR20]